jgi:hypothetical protein
LYHQGPKWHWESPPPLRIEERHNEGQIANYCIVTPRDTPSRQPLTISHFQQGYVAPSLHV